MNSNSEEPVAPVHPLPPQPRAPAVVCLQSVEGRREGRGEGGAAKRIFSLLLDMYACIIVLFIKPFP